MTGFLQRFSESTLSFLKVQPRRLYGVFEMRGTPKGLLLIRFSQNEMIGTYQMKSLTCIPKRSQLHGTAREKSTMMVRSVNLFRILRNLTIWAPSTSCFSS